MRGRVVGFCGGGFLNAGWGWVVNLEGRIWQVVESRFVNGGRGQGGLG